MTGSNPTRTVLKPGTRVYHRVFDWMSGEVVSGNGSMHYEVRLDPDIEHHSGRVWISPNEIVVEKPRRRRAASS